ncbi:MAG: hypothetical protein JXP34_20450, partial [Planctomycetes bacterium]|nr:hypothetical protein [Planctomycetota bacterium]
AREGGAAGWCLHNGSPRRGSDGPARSFDLRKGKGRLFDQLDADERFVTDHVAAAALSTSRTWVVLFQRRWFIDGRVTCPGAPAEGLLPNVRMINAVFEDRNPATCPKGFDPDANTDAFIRRIPDYVAHGIRAFTIGLQGGMPGYESAVNSAFTPEGELRPEYLARVRRAIEAADAAGAAVILSCFYQRQDQILRDADAVRAGVRAAARWVRESGFGHVILEIANEYPHGGFDREILRGPEGMASLIRLAREAAPGLLVSASGLGDGKGHEAVAEAADFVTIHFNSTPVDRIAGRVEALRRFGKAIVCNEDDKTGREAARAAEASVAAGCSYGLMLKDVNQYVPFEFGGAADDEVVYSKLTELATPSGSGEGR